MEFEREGRYLVLKVKDIEKHLSETDKLMLQAIADKVTAGRINSGKTCLEFVVIESDWPMYKQTWQRVEQWANSPKRCGYVFERPNRIPAPGPENPPPSSCVRPVGHDGQHKDKYGHFIPQKHTSEAI